MQVSRRLKLYLFPSLILIPLGLAGVAWEIYNLHYRGVSTPFLYPALGLLLVSLFFWVKNKWAYLMLLILTGVFLFFFFRHTLWIQQANPSVVYYYQDWVFETKSGLIKPKQPIGPNPPVTGGYLSCNFSLIHWWDYLNTQPQLCTAFDQDHRLTMFLNDSEGMGGKIREFQLNYFRADRKSLLGEPLDRWALRLAYRPIEAGFREKFRLLSIYQVYEREIGNGRSKIVESFSRKADGSLKTFTESPLLKFSQKDVYALYGFDGELIEIPNRGRRNFSFPARIDVRGYQSYDLPDRLQSNNKP